MTRLSGITSVTQKGQVTIPVEVRERLGIRPYDRVRFTVRDGVAVVEKVGGSLDEFVGSVPALHRPDDPDFSKRIREAKEEKALRDYGRAEA